MTEPIPLNFLVAVLMVLASVAAAIYAIRGKKWGANKPARGIAALSAIILGSGGLLWLAGLALAAWISTLFKPDPNEGD